MNAGDVLVHRGCKVLASFNDMSIEVECPGHDAPLEDVLPEFVSPLRWRPKPGDRVTLYERIPSTRPDAGVTWAGWTCETGNTSLVPTWLDPGKVHVISEEGEVCIALEDRPDPDAAQGAGNLPAVRVGGRAADSPLVCGTEFEAWAGAVLDAIKSLSDAVKGQATALKAHTHPVSGTATGVPADIVSYQTTESVADSTSSTISTKKGDIPDILSDFVFTQKGPD